MLSCYHCNNDEPISVRLQMQFLRRGRARDLGQPAADGLKLWMGNTDSPKIGARSLIGAWNCATDLLKTEDQVCIDTPCLR
jgi:hypothetical protein